MRILIVAATQTEIKSSDLFINKIINNKIDTLITGIGGVATTYALTDYLNGNKVDIIIQAGIAGCFTKNILGEVFAVKTETFADLGVWENKKFNSVFDLNLEHKNNFPFKRGLLQNPNKKLLALSHVKKVSGISVNEITTDKKRIDWLKQNLSPFVESMEGAAFHYVCLQKQIPFIQLRAISNFVGQRNKAKWKIKEAVTNLNEKLIALLNELSNYDETYFRI